MEKNFYAMLSRMKYIERWALMRNTQTENIAEHSLEVSILAHALAVIHNKRLGGNINEERAALIALYHDSTEIITGDMPTPIKYLNKEIQTAFKDVEKLAANKLLSMLPQDFRESYENLFFPKAEETYLWKLVKAADKLSALIKCIQEENSGNTEFASAKKSITDALIDMHMEEVNIFMEEFLLSYYKTLDELN
jgi:5'-deoxynucleotidase